MCEFVYAIGLVFHHLWKLQENDVQSSVEDALRHGQEQLHSAEEYFNDLKKSVENMLETSLGLPESKHRAEDSIDK